MTYVSVKEKAAEIRKTLKEMGITSKQVSITSGSCGYSSRITAEIKDLTVKMDLVTEIANRHESIRYDERSGEILEGCNTYVRVELDYNAQRAAKEEMMEVANRIYEDGKTYTGTGQGECIADCENMGATYYPDEHEIILYEYHMVTNDLETYQAGRTKERVLAWGPSDIALALGVWKYQHGLKTA